MFEKSKGSIAAIGTGFWLFVYGAANSQTIETPPPPAVPQAILPPAPTIRTVKLPEGTEVKLELQEELSSSSSSEGDNFEVVSVSDIPLSNGMDIPPGYSGRGEITHAEHTGWLGKSGQLNIKLDYLKIGDTRIHLRGNKGGEGKGNTGNIVVAAVFFGVFAAAVHGHSIVYPEGTTMTAYVDTDTEIPLPIASPPQAR
jgi:hypothetical protein